MDFDHAVGHLTETYQITGGTGRFEGAKGSFALTATLKAVLFNASNAGRTFDEYGGALTEPFSQRRYGRKGKTNRNRSATSPPGENEAAVRHRFACTDTIRRPPCSERRYIKSVLADCPGTSSSRACPAGCGDCTPNHPPTFHFLRKRCASGCGNRE